MRKNYILNKKTGTLHFQGCCQYVSATIKEDSNYAFFSSENDAKKKNAISVKWCKVCARKIANKLDK
ncbi:MAG: hypothetical protein MJ083_01370 [Clostridia bacterium]|nr:hypothetical protein [Clostridia bacterium]